MRAPASRPGRVAALAAVAAALALGACGDDDETTTPQAGSEAWTADAEAICAEGSDEAIALPLPGSRKQVAADAGARAEILTTARDELAGLDVPEDVDEQALGDYIAELDADIEQLAAISAGGPVEQLDESSGQIASELGLDECAAFANAIARTP